MEQDGLDIILFYLGLNVYQLEFRQPRMNRTQKIAFSRCMFGRLYIAMRLKSHPTKTKIIYTEQNGIVDRACLAANLDAFRVLRIRFHH